MIDWKNTIDISNINKDYEDGLITAQQVAGKLVDKLLSVFPIYVIDAGEFKSIIDNLKELSKKPTSTINDYDDTLEKLYDWADINHRLCINS